jgi:hypothetical protein
MKYNLVNISVAKDNKHKYVATLSDKEGKIHSIKFGAKGYSDYTIHKDSERKKRYIIRHKKKEDWTSSGILTPGFWSRWILWNKPGYRESIDNTKSKFNL